MNEFIKNGKKFLIRPQNSVVSAASVIMVMVVASRILGLIRQRVLANYFAPDELSLFFAAFRLPDLLFEVLVFGTFSSAFIPVFTKEFKERKSLAWETAGRVVNIGLLIFVVFALLFGIFAQPIYSFMAPGFSEAEILRIAQIARILFAAQGFFVVSYILTGVLESQRRFLIPALAPVFYNLGIILLTVLLSPSLGLLAPTLGVVLGALAHFLTQLPLAHKLGFKFVWGIRPDEGTKKIGKLALPRVIDLSFDQIGKTAELFLASLISTASYTYFTFANILQVLPVTLFGTSLAKASLPLLSRQGDDPISFRKTLLTAISQSIFLTVPISIALIVLRIPAVRLVYGTRIFDWASTVQTGMVLSTFALGITFQTLVAILGRAFFALHDTKTPVFVSFVGLFLLVVGDFLLVIYFGLPVWALAASFSFSVFIETILLFYLMERRIGGILTKGTFIRFFKILLASVPSGLTMYFILKFFDRSVWIKRISFVSAINLPFERFVLDTRYTLNLLILTFIVAAVGMAIYFGISYLAKSEELVLLFSTVRRIFQRKKVIVSSKETISTPIDEPS